MSEPTQPVKFSEREARIEKRAFELWEQDGRPEGQAEHHWHRAAGEVDQEYERSAQADAQPNSATRPAMTGRSRP